MKYDCWIPEYGQQRGDGRTVENDDSGYAAQEFVRDYERRTAEYPVASGSSIEVAVCRTSDANLARAFTYIVTGWAEPTYRARLKL